MKSLQIRTTQSSEVTIKTGMLDLHGLKMISKVLENQLRKKKKVIFKKMRQIMKNLAKLKVK
jgi:hypothetical protein